MISYKALTRATITLQKIEDIAIYDCDIFSSNGNILQPYDINTTLTGVVYNDFKDITKDFPSENIRWTIWNEDFDEEFKKQWNEEHIGQNPITVSCDEINGKAVIQFEVYKTNSNGLDTLIACNRITLIDINDLLTTTDKPTSPYEGQLWVDTSVTPANILVWKNNKWNVTGTVSTVVKNLIKNSNFITYSYDYFDIVGEEKDSYAPTVQVKNGRKWLNLKSDTLSNSLRGISQTTNIYEEIKTNSKYSFQFLAYASYESTTYNNSINIDIISINEKDEEEYIYSTQDNNNITLKKDVCKFFTSFTTLENTKKLKVQITGKNGYRYDFNITQLALYNTENDYPWQSHPEDSSEILDPEKIFNALTNNGEIQGLYKVVDPETGQIQIYFNAEYIKSGKIKGDYIDAYNLSVKRKDNDTVTFEIDENGNVNLVVNKLTIQSTGQSLEDFVVSNSDKNQRNSLIAIIDEIKKEYITTEYTYNQIYNNNSFRELDYKGDMNNWLDPEDIPVETITKTYELLFYVYKSYLTIYEKYKATLQNCLEDYENNKEKLDINKEKYSIKLGIINKFFIACHEYISDAIVEFNTEKWSQMQIDIGGITTDVGELQEAFTNEDGVINSIKKELNSVKQEITPQALTTKVQHIVETDTEIQTHIETVSKQTAEGFNQETVDKLNGNFSKLEQTVNGFSEKIESVEKKPNYKLEIYTPDGTVLQSKGITTTVYAKVFNWDEDITDTIPETSFNWYRRSKDQVDDEYWNGLYGKGKKSITISTSDILASATFYFTVDI